MVPISAKFAILTLVCQLNKHGPRVWNLSDHSKRLTGAFSMFNHEYLVPAYVYKITCVVTNEFYFGYRARNQKLNRLPNDDLWHFYFTSSKSILSLVKKYEKTSFRAEILYCDIKSENCFWYEQEQIKQHFGNPLLLNKTFHDKDLGHKVFKATHGRCAFCNKRIGSGNLERHELVCFHSPNKVIKTRPKSPCRFCNRFFGPGNHSNHERGCAMNPHGMHITYKKANSGVCCYCKQTFNLIGLSKHEKRCIENPSYTNRTVCAVCHLDIPANMVKKHQKICQARIPNSHGQTKIQCNNCNKTIGSCAWNRHIKKCSQKLKCS